MSAYTLFRFRRFSRRWATALLVLLGLLILLEYTSPAWADDEIPPLGKKGPWYRNPPKEANSGVLNLNTPQGTVKVEWWNWLRDDYQGGQTGQHFRAWYYAYRLTNLNYGQPPTPWVATFAFVFDSLNDLNIQGYGASTSDLVPNPAAAPGDEWQQYSQWDNVLGKWLFGWQAFSAAPAPVGLDDGLDIGFQSSGGHVYETPDGYLSDYYFEIVSFSRAPAPAQVVVSSQDMMETQTKTEDVSRQISGIVPGPGQLSMGTAFTYQGRLTDDGNPAVGWYDLRFRLYDDPNEGWQLGETNQKEDRHLRDGYFTEVLDFGSEIFDGRPYWLEVAVRPSELNDPNEFEPLAGRQQIRPTPYALYAASSGNANQVAGLDVGNEADQVPISNGIVCTNLNADMVDGKHAGNLAQRTVFYIPGGGASTTFEFPHYVAFTVTLTEAHGSPDTNAVGFVHCIENDGWIAWQGFDGQGNHVQGRASLSGITTIMTIRGGNITLATPGDGSRTLTVTSAAGQDVRGLMVW